MLNVCELFIFGLLGVIGCLLVFKGIVGFGKICLIGSWVKVFGCIVYWGGGDLLLLFKLFIIIELGIVCDVDKMCWIVFLKGVLLVWLVVL